MNLIRRELARLNILYPQKRSGDELEVVARTWVTDLKDVGDKDFLAGLAEVRKRSRFFPTPAEILDACRQAQARPRPEPPALDFGPEAKAAQCRLNKRWIARILGKINQPKKRCT